MASRSRCARRPRRASAVGRTRKSSAGDFGEQRPPKAKHKRPIALSVATAAAAAWGHLFATKRSQHNLFMLISLIIILLSILPASSLGERQAVKSARGHKYLAGGISGRALANHLNGSASDESGAERLAAIQSQLLDLRRQLEAELSAGGRQAALGSPCAKHADCQRGVSKAHCETNNFTCACLPQHVQLNSTTCLPPSLLGFECLLDAQCTQRVQNSFCSPISRTCTCSEGFVGHRRDKCLAPSEINDFCLADGQCQLADKHSSCRWRIPKVYGTCKCPPNFKLVVGASGRRRCAPRLGDTCLSSEECQLATSNSQCAPTAPSLPSWPSSSATSSHTCTCAPNHTAAASALECAPTVELLSVPLANEKHHYEMIVISSGQTSAAAAAPAPVAASDVRDLAATGPELPPPPTRAAAAATTLTTTTTTATAATAALEATTLYANQTNSRGAASSLGKPCESSAECMASDKNSHCVFGLCECLAPTSACSATRTGCHKDTFQCRSGQCISWYFVCDQFKNCDDGSDELECEPFECPPQAFQCKSDGKCLTRGKICDGKLDCQDGSDEEGCGGRLGNATATGACRAGAFACSSGNQCLPAYVLCNAVQDCADGSDELESLCARTAPTRQKRPPPSQPAPPLAPQKESPLVKTNRAAIERLLAAGGRRKSRLLSPATTPPAGGECPLDAFTCKNGKCRSSAILCSGVDGCGDNSDEARCEVCKCSAPADSRRAAPIDFGRTHSPNKRRETGK